MQYTQLYYEINCNQSHWKKLLNSICFHWCVIKLLFVFSLPTSCCRLKLLNSTSKQQHSEKLCDQETAVLHQIDTSVASRNTWTNIRMVLSTYWRHLVSFKWANACAVNLQIKTFIIPFFFFFLHLTVWTIYVLIWRFKTSH